MAEWHLPPEYIFDNWTWEELDMMAEKLAGRKKREADAMGRHPHVVPDEQFFRQAGIKYMKVNRGN